MTMTGSKPMHYLGTLAFSALAVTGAHADEAAQIARGKKLFATATPACAACHTLKSAGAEGMIGPSLDELQPDAARVARALRDGIGSMPSFKAHMNDADIHALALYVSQASAQK